MNQFISIALWTSFLILGYIILNRLINVYMFTRHQVIDTQLLNTFIYSVLLFSIIYFSKQEESVLLISTFRTNKYGYTLTLIAAFGTLYGFQFNVIMKEAKSVLGLTVNDLRISQNRTLNILNSRVFKLFLGLTVGLPFVTSLYTFEIMEIDFIVFWELSFVIFLITFCIILFSLTNSMSLYRIHGAEVSWFDEMQAKKIRINQLKQYFIGSLRRTGKYSSGEGSTKYTLNSIVEKSDNLSQTLDLIIEMNTDIIRAYEHDLCIVNEMKDKTNKKKIKIFINVHYFYQEVFRGILSKDYEKITDGFIHINQFISWNSKFEEILRDNLEATTFKHWEGYILNKLRIVEKLKSIDERNQITSKGWETTDIFEIPSELYDKIENSDQVKDLIGSIIENRYTNLTTAKKITVIKTLINRTSSLYSKKELEIAVIGCEEKVKEAALKVYDQNEVK